MSFTKSVKPLATALAICATAAQASEHTVLPQVVYGQGQVTQNGEVIERDLWMDLYLPDAEHPTGVIFMTFGGAYHRGHPHQPYQMEGAQTTSMKQYCETFVNQGYACVNIDYRLAPEFPVPTREGYSDDQLDMSSAYDIQGQANLVRGIMGLEPLDFDDPDDFAIVENTVLAATEDLRSAIAFVRANADQYGIDPAKVVLGGFSAGAVTSLNVSHGLKVPVKGTMMLGTADIGFDIKQAIQSGDEAAPLLMFQGQYDLPATLIHTPGLLQHLEQVGVDYSYNWIPAAGHFYPAGAVALSGDGLRLSVEQRMLAFVERVLD